MVGQGPAVLAAGAVGGLFCCCCCFFISSIPSSFSNASSVERRLGILKYCNLDRYNPAAVISYHWRLAREVLVNRLVGISLSRNSVNE